MKEKTAIGIATDGDADRFGIVDGDGDVHTAELRHRAAVRLSGGVARVEERRGEVGGDDESDNAPGR